MRQLLDARTSRAVAEVLWQYRITANLTQAEAGNRSGVGEKTISTFETRDRISAIKFSQLLALLATYGVTLARFADDLDANLAELRRAS